MQVIQPGLRIPALNSGQQPVSRVTHALSMPQSPAWRGLIPCAEVQLSRERRPPQPPLDRWLWACGR